MLNGALPPFDLGAGGFLLALVRTLSVAALLSAYGALVFRSVVAPRAFVEAPPEAVARADRLLLRLTRASLGVAAAGVLAWLGLETVAMAGADTMAEALAAFPTVLLRTSFGHTILAQLAALLASGLVLGVGRHRLATASAGLATLLQVGHSHAYSMADGPPGLVLSDGLHLLAAGAWLGGLVPLILLVRTLPPKSAAIACRWFSPLGKLCVATLAVSAAYQGWVLAGGVPGLVGSAYGWVLGVKLALLGVLLGFAWANRYRFAPALRGSDPERAKRVLMGSIAWQTGAGLLVILASGVLSSLPPGMHLQPVWPFTLRPSLDAVESEPSLLREVVLAAIALAVAGLMTGLALQRRRLRWPALGLAGAIVWVATPHLAPLLVEAYPTSFDRSPTGFAATGIARGAALFPEHCAACHGMDGRGNGPAAKTLPVPPADLTAGHLWGHSDGELFWWLTHGIDAPEGGLAMPGFAGVLSDAERWDLIDAIRARNAGLAHAATGAWPAPVQAPGFRATCPDGSTRTLESVRGKLAAVRFGSDASAAAVAFVVLFEPAGTEVSTPPRECTTFDPAVSRAYAVVGGFGSVPAGTWFLVDPDGWLRTIEAPGAPDSAVLAAVREIRAHPIGAAEGTRAHHDMGSMPMGTMTPP